jgi:uncharacterized membrane protein YkvA (DUF1232 family)
MALHGLLRVGIRAAIVEHGDELERIAVNAGMPEGTGPHLAQTLEAVPGMLVALDTVVATGDAATRQLWFSVLSYVLLDDDLLPSRDGGPIFGVLDDAYLVHAAVERLLDRVSAQARIDARSVAGGRQLLRLVLPAGVVRKLDDKVDALLPRGAGT